MRAALIGFAGVVLLGALCYSALMLRAEDIQETVQRRTSAAIAATGADWAELYIDGRDVRLGGVAPSEAAKARAIETARAVPGVRKVGGWIRVDAAVSPYVWSLEHAGGEIVLSGVVPDRESRRRLHDLAQRSFGRPVQDRTRIARGAPGEGWLIAASFGIRQLARLDDRVRDGKAVLHDTALTLSGRPKGLGADDDSPAGTDFEAAAQAALVGPFEAKLEIFDDTTAADSAIGDAAPEIAAPEPAPPDIAPLDRTACQSRIDGLLADRGIDFASGRREPTPASRALIGEIAAALAGCRRFDLEVGGHTDSTGQSAANLRLSRLRAGAVAEALAEDGVPTERLHAVGHGAGQPIADNATEAGRARNRRIEITVLSEVATGN